MKKGIYCTKKEIEKEFKILYAYELSGLFKTDKPMKQQCWNDYVDSLKKANCIDPNSDWDQPKFIQN